MGLGRYMSRADVVISGEGALDVQSFLGKVVGGVVEDANVAGVTAVVVAGQVTTEARAEATRRGVSVESLVERFGPTRAMSDPLSCVEEIVADVLDRFGSSFGPA
jgi:glycerate kinase